MIYRKSLNLHSIMYLLILAKALGVSQPELNLHSIMYLLILLAASSTAESTSSFTFHNVSINSGVLPCLVCRIFLFTFHNVSINSEIQYNIDCDNSIYIP